MKSDDNKYRIAGLAALPLGMVFVLAGIGKFLQGGQSSSPLPSFVPQPLAEGIFTTLPYIELIIGGLLIVGVAIKLISSISILFIIGFAVSNILLVTQGGNECSGCFGAWGGLAPTASLILDGIMAVLVMVILFCYRGGFFRITPWFIVTTQRKMECEYV